MFEWLFGGGRRTEADALRDEVMFLRDQLEVQRGHFEARMQRLEKANDRLREENITLTNAGVMAQLEAYRQARRMPATPPAPAEKPRAADDLLWMQDHAADDALPPDAMPTDDDMRIEAAARYREQERLRAARGEPTREPQTVDETAGEAMPA